MKLFLFIIFAATFSFAATPKKLSTSKPCEVAKIKEQEIEVIATNIANVNTTSTEEGGPYKRKTMKCRGLDCQVVAEAKFVRKYMPDHVDADMDGYVEFPDIKVESEINKMLRASAEYDSAKIRCN